MNKEPETKSDEQSLENEMLIEKGWRSFRTMVVPKNASKRQVTETRQAFYAGAAILMESLLIVMDSDREPTEKDIIRMGNIAEELQTFGLDLDKKLYGDRVH